MKTYCIAPQSKANIMYNILLSTWYRLVNTIQNGDLSYVTDNLILNGKGDRLK